MKSRKPHCRDVFRHICGNLDEDLNSRKCRSIKKHLQGCPDCRGYLDSLKETILLYRRYPVPKRSTARKEIGGRRIHTSR